MLCCSRPQAPPEHTLQGTNLGVSTIGGTGGGSSFDDQIYNRGITAVTAWWGAGSIVGLKFEYDGVIGQTWGFTGTNYVIRWAAPKGQYISKVLAHSDDIFVRGLQFWAEDGNYSPFFGYVTGPRIDLGGAAGEVLTSASGRCGSMIDSLQLTFGPRPQRTPTILITPAVGGGGGAYFIDNMDGPMAAITGFKINHAAAIDRLCVQYGGVFATPHGGTGGTEATWLVPSDEYVSQVTAYTNGSTVLGLQFFTNRNSRSPLFGQLSGSRVQLQGTDACPALALVGGRSGALLDNVFFGFAQLQAERYVIRDVQYEMPSIQQGEVLVVASATAENNTDKEQQTTTSMSYQLTETASWTEENSATVGFSVTIETQAGAVFAKVSTSTTLSSSWTGTWSTTKENSQTTLIQVDQTITVPPHKTITGQLIATKVSANCAWRGTKYAVVNGQRQDNGVSVQGTFTAKTACNFYVKWQQS